MICMYKYIYICDIESRCEHANKYRCNISAMLDYHREPQMTLQTYAQNTRGTKKIGSHFGSGPVCI